MNRWTQEEDAILDAVYPHHGIKGVNSILPHRGLGAIQQRAHTQDLRVLRRSERSDMTAEQIAAQVRKKIADAVKPLSKPLSASVEGEKKRKFLGPHGMIVDYGTTAGTKDGLEKVPDAATSLPWVSYPRDSQTANAVAAACEYMARSSDAVKKIGPEAQRFFESQARYLRALAERMQVSTAA